MVHAKKKKKPRSRSLAGTRAGEELARARARRRGKIAVFEGGPDKTITEKTPVEIEAERRFDVSKEVDKLELQEKVKRQRDEGPIQSFPLEEKEKGIFGKIGEFAGKFDLEKVSGEQIAQGIVPIGPAGGLKAAGTIQPAISGIGKVLATGGKAGKLEKVITNILKTGKPKGLTAAEFAFRREVQALKITKAFPKMTDKKAIRMINTFNKFDKPKIVQLMTKRPLIVTVGSLIGADTIGVWWALDNILDGQKFLIPDVEEAIAAGEMTFEEARDLIGESDTLVEMAASFVETSARINPILWGARKFLIKGTEVKKAAYELRRDNFLGQI